MFSFVFQQRLEFIDIMSIDYNICLIIIGNVLVFIFCYMLCREHDGNCLSFVLFQPHSHFTVM